MRRHGSSSSSGRAAAPRAAKRRAAARRASARGRKERRKRAQQQQQQEQLRVARNPWHWEHSRREQAGGEAGGSHAAGSQALQVTWVRRGPVAAGCLFVNHSINYIYYSKASCLVYGVAHFCLTPAGPPRGTCSRPTSPSAAAPGPWASCSGTPPSFSALGPGGRLTSLPW